MPARASFWASGWRRKFHSWGMRSPARTLRWALMRFLGGFIVGSFMLENGRKGEGENGRLTAESAEARREFRGNSPGLSALPAETDSVLPGGQGAEELAG